METRLYPCRPQPVRPVTIHIHQYCASFKIMECLAPTNTQYPLLLYVVVIIIVIILFSPPPPPPPPPLPPLPFTLVNMNFLNASLSLSKLIQINLPPPTTPHQPHHISLHLYPHPPPSQTLTKPVISTPFPGKPRQQRRLIGSPAALE